MDVGEIPMILFTVLAQMSVGAFIVLGVIQLLGAARYSSKAMDRLSDPALLAIGPTLVAGLGVSMLHMHNPLNAIHVIRHWDSSWLSREIIFGMAFAGAGFVFAAAQARKWGSPSMRRILAAVTALLGVGLVWSMANVYVSLETVPTWNSWFTIVQFFATAIILGGLAVGTAFVVVTHLRQRRIARGDLAPDTSPLARYAGISLTPADEETRVEVDELLARSIRGIVISTLATAGALLVSLPLYLSQQAALGGASAQHAAAVYGGWHLVVRLGLLVAAVALVALFAYILAGQGRSVARLVPVMLSVLVLAAVGELIGRSMFYESMFRIGM